MKRTFSADIVFPLDGTAPIRGGSVTVDGDGTVLAVGEADGSEDEVLSGALAPGFVNAHCHLELSYMKGLFRKGTGMAGFIDQINELRDVKPRAERLKDISYWLDLMWKRGVSAMADISNCADTFSIKASHPMYSRTFLEVFGDDPARAGEVMSSARALCAEAASLGLDAAPTPHSCYTMSPELLRLSSEAALEAGWLSYHSEESSEEDELIRSGSGKMWENRVRNGIKTPPVTGGSSLEYFFDILSGIHPAPFNERILLVHEVCMDEKGVDLVEAMAPGNCFVALCPLSNLFIHNTLPDIDMLWRRGVKLCVGTDSLSSNDDLDMVGELFCIQEHFPAIPLGTLLGWACANGAEFLGKEGVLGSITHGKKPGIVHITNLSPDGRLTSGSRSERIA